MSGETTIRSLLEISFLLMASSEPSGPEGGATFSREAISKLVERHHRYLLAMLVYRTGNEETALDLLQETYLSFLRAVAGGGAPTRFDDETKVRNYLFTIAVNKVKDHYRASGRESARILRFRDRDGMEACLEGLASRERPPDEAFAAESERDAVSACTRLAMENLPERFRKVLRLKFSEGMENPGIARAMGVGIKAVESLLSRAKQAFRKEFEKLSVGANE